MKTRIYLRIARTRKGIKVIATTKLNYEAITTVKGYRSVIHHPTVIVALDLDIPEKEFEAVRILLEAKICSTQPAVKIKQIKEVPEEQNENIERERNEPCQDLQKL